jgi:hypothetical protein
VWVYFNCWVRLVLNIISYILKFLLSMAQAYWWKSFVRWSHDLLSTMALRGTSTEWRQGSSPASQTQQWHVRIKCAKWHTTHHVAILNLTKQTEKTPTAQVQVCLVTLPSRPGHLSNSHLYSNDGSCDSSSISLCALPKLPWYNYHKHLLLLSCTMAFLQATCRQAGRQAGRQAYVTVLRAAIVKIL